MMELLRQAKEAAHWQNFIMVRGLMLRLAQALQDLDTASREYIEAHRGMRSRFQNAEQATKYELAARKLYALLEIE